MATFPTDQFDNLPDDLQRVGAHRGPKVRGRGWIAFAWAVLATGILMVVGLFLLSQLNDQIKFTLPGVGAAASTPSATPTPTKTPTVAAITDPTKIKARKIVITVLNGTPTAGLQNQAGSKLKAAKWTVGSQALASATNIKQTVVYYSRAVNEDVARGVALALGVTTVRLSDAFPGAPITVVLGTDFKG